MENDFSSLFLFAISIFTFLPEAVPDSDEMFCYYCNPYDSEDCMVSNKMLSMKCKYIEDYIDSKDDLEENFPRCFYIDFVSKGWRRVRKYSCSNYKRTAVTGDGKKYPVCEAYQKETFLNGFNIKKFVNCKSCDSDSCNHPQRLPTAIPSRTTLSPMVDLVCYYCKPTSEDCSGDLITIGKKAFTSTSEYYYIKTQILLGIYQRLIPKCYYLEYEDRLHKVQKKYGCTNDTMINPFKKNEILRICDYFRTVKISDFDTVERVIFCGTCDKHLCNVGRKMKHDDNDKDKNGSGQKYYSEILGLCILSLLITIDSLQILMK